MMIVNGLYNVSSTSDIVQSRLSSRNHCTVYSLVYSEWWYLVTDHHLTAAMLVSSIRAYCAS